MFKSIKKIKRSLVIASIIFITLMTLRWWNRRQINKNRKSRQHSGGDGDGDGDDNDNDTNKHNDAVTTTSSSTFTSGNQYNQYNISTPPETIFVSIPSYRDSLCAKTIFQCFSRAAYPERIYIGVYEQNAPHDKSCMHEFLNLCANNISTGNGIDYEYLRKNIRLYSTPHIKAKGPSYARAMIEKHLLRDEDYFMGIDSHTEFVENWDIKCIKCLQRARLQSAKPILTCYPHDISIYHQHIKKQKSSDPPGTYLRFGGFDKKSNWGTMNGPGFIKVPSEPVPSLFFSNTFCFMPTQAIKQCPTCPLIPFVFQGDELFQGCRLWTRGWDFFHPPRSIVFHKWSRKYRPTFWELFTNPSVSRQQKKSENKIRCVLGIRIPTIGDDLLPPEYDLGNTRSLADYQKFCGVYFYDKAYEPCSMLGISPEYTQHPHLNTFILQRYSSVDYYYGQLNHIKSKE